MSKTTEAAQTAKTTAKKSATKKPAVEKADAEPVKVKCRVLKKIEIGQAEISAKHPHPVLIEVGKAKEMASLGMVQIVGI